MSRPPLIFPEWPAPAGVKAVSSLRTGGVSAAPWQSLNLGAHVTDVPEHVAENRRRFAAAAVLPSAPAWLSQVHGTRVIDAAVGADPPPEADGAFTTRAGIVCAVLTADCLPVLLCDTQMSCVAAVHAGWRGLAAGVLEAAVGELEAVAKPQNLMAWLGPAIGPEAFEVGGEVREQFVAEDERASAAFQRHGERWLADLPALARARLAGCGVHAVYGGDHCTFSDSARFFSYRRDGQTGRMATAIWLDP
ncbi:MAG: peptidoglycan editing factor PgeF [Pseudomonadota bacterium]